MSDEITDRDDTLSEIEVCILFSHATSMLLYPCSRSVILLRLISKKRVIIMRQRKGILLVCSPATRLTWLYMYRLTVLKSKRSELDDGIKIIERDLEKSHLPQVYVHVLCVPWD